MRRFPAEQAFFRAPSDRGEFRWRPLQTAREGGRLARNWRARDDRRPVTPEVAGFESRRSRFISSRCGVLQARVAPRAFVLVRFGQGGGRRHHARF